MPATELSDLFERMVLEAWESGSSLLPAHDFDAPRAGIAPGNLWDAPSRWQDPAKRGLIGDVPASLADHSARDELLESFVPDDYCALNADLPSGLSDDQAREHFIESGYARRRLYSRAIAGAVQARFYAKQVGSLKRDDLAAQRHYSYQGRFEDRHPNDLSAWFASCRVHLWQVGKVGSISIQNALREQHDIHSIHLHYVDAWHRGLPKVGPHYSRLLHHGRSEPALIVCGIRDPIDRVISGYFQESESLGIDTTEHIDTESVVRRLAGRILDDLWITCRWFSHNFFAGIDVYRHPFDHEEGCCEIDAGSVRVLVYRLENLAQLGPRIASFLGIDELDIQQRNISAGKPYAARYADVRRAAVLPPDVIEAVRSCKMCRHFWPE